MNLLRSIRSLWARPVVRKIAVVGILLLTVCAFARFFMTHPQYWRQLKQVEQITIFEVLALNGLLIVILSGIYRVSVNLCGKDIKPRENFLLTAYSSIVNFFGPLQSGPGVRAAYLKTKLSIRLRDYTFVTLLYLGIFAVINIGFLFAVSQPWWQTAIALLLGIGFSAFVIRHFRSKDTQPSESGLFLKPKLVAALAVLTFLQILILSIMYGIELRAIGSTPSIGQTLSYTGAANLALFVSLTPGAVGFRESFLYFSQSLHHISTANILSANLIDRACYVIFLLVLLVIVLSMHAGKKLGITELKQSSAKSSSEQ